MEKIKKRLSEFKDSLSNGNNYVAYYYKEVDGNIYSIELYFINIKDKKLYVIYTST